MINKQPAAHASARPPLACNRRVRILAGTGRSGEGVEQHWQIMQGKRKRYITSGERAAATMGSAVAAEVVAAAVAARPLPDSFIESSLSTRHEHVT